MEDKGNSGSTAVDSVENNPSPGKKSDSKAKSKTQKAKPTHPPASEMVIAAIKGLQDRKGSSIQAIKKHVVTTYNLDAEKITPFIKRYLKSAVASGAIIQTKGKGASGSFKLPPTKTEPKPKVKAAAKPAKKTVVKETKKSVEKKTSPKKAAVTASPTKAKPAKKAAAEKKKPSPAKSPKPAKSTATETAKSPAESKAVSKTKKTAKAPAAKTKTPKPKKAAAAKGGKATAKK